MLARSPTRALEATKGSTCGTALRVCDYTSVSIILLPVLFIFYVWVTCNHHLVFLFVCFLAFFVGLALLCFLAAMRHHRLTERVANFRETLFVLVVLEDRLDWSFWLGVGSVGTHFAICGVVAMSRIKLPKPEIKKPEEPTISSLDLLYWTLTFSNELSD